MNPCDGCGKDRDDVRPIGRDANGDSDGPGFCFFCRREWARQRVFDRKTGKYVPEGSNAMQNEITDAEGQTAAQWAEELFEFELCNECHGDVADHDYVLVMGHWFARCKTSAEE